MADCNTEDLDLKSYLEICVQVARKAGKEIKNAFFETKTTETKAHAADLVTETDELVEQIIITSLKDKFPTHSFIAEESTAKTGQHVELTDNPTWIIDPIDGTTNFVHSHPYSVVSIGMTIKRQLVVGVIYNPMLDEMFTATKGGGAFCNGHRIHVSGQEDIRQCLVGATVGLTEVDRRMANVRAMVTAGIHGRIPMSGFGLDRLRNSGSAAANLCFVASGSLDAFFEYGLHSWDVAAGILIVQEAGGVVIDPATEGPVDLMSRRILATSSQKLASSIAPLLTNIEYPRD